MYELRPYQVEAIAEIERAWESGHRSTILVLATGLGKTTVFTEIARRARDARRGRTLVLAHRIELVEQAAARLETGTLTTEIESGDRRASWLQLPTSDAVVATVQTMRGRRLERWPRDAFGTIVIDEAHHATARAYRDVLAHFSAARVLGVTATPDRGDEVALGHVFESTAYTYGIREGIEGGYLAPLRCKTIDLDCVSLDGVRVTRQEHGRDLSADDVAKAMSGDEALHAIAAPVAKEAGARKTLIFMPSVELTHELARVLSGYVGADRVRSLDGSCDKDDRKEQLRAYTHGDVQFMVNCALFTEGFDAPSTSCVVVARPTKSRALYAQMVGRGTRLADGKTDCLVIDLHPSNTRHDLAKIADIFDGLDLPDDGEERDLFDAAIRSGETVLDARKQAKEIHAKREAARRADRERARMQAQVTYRAVERPMWSVDIALGVTASMYGTTVPPAREDQLERLRALKLDIDPRETVQSASAKIKAMLDRRKSGLCTIKQARVLARAGLNPDLTFDQARTAMDMLVANRWRATPDMIAKWGAR